MAMTDSYLGLPGLDEISGGFRKTVAGIVRAVLLMIVCLSVHLLTAAQTSSLLRVGYGQGDFKLVYGGQAADIVV